MASLATGLTGNILKARTALCIAAILASTWMTNGLAAAPKFLENLYSVHLQMTRDEVTNLLGQPDASLRREAEGESIFFRFATLRRRENPDSDATSLDAGRVRIDLEAGRVAHIAGLLPKPERPPSGTAKDKVLLVEGAKVYEKLSVTAQSISRLEKQKADAEAQVDAGKGEVDKLIAEYGEILERAKKSKDPAEKKARETDAEHVLARIIEKQQFFQNFIATKTRELNEQRERTTDLVLPCVSDAILGYAKEHGFQHVFELRDNVFSPGTKPSFVAGIDATADITAWINSGGAGPYGLPKVEPAGLNAPP